jgi:hypothetical protein
MNFLKPLIFIAAILATVASSAAQVSFVCSNAPASKWGKYLSMTASTSDFKILSVDMFGVVEGSSKAEEEEPVNTVENFKAPARASLAATSAEWRNATAFDLSSKLGPAVIYLHPSEFNGTNKRVVARLKFDGKDLRLTCGYSIDAKK